MNLCAALLNHTLNPSCFVRTKEKSVPQRQESQKLSTRDQRTKVALLLGSLLCIVLALNRFCAAIALPGSRSVTASGAPYHDDIGMLQQQLTQGKPVATIGAQ
jgi:hypothetical protein